MALPFARALFVWVYVLEELKGAPAFKRGVFGLTAGALGLYCRVCREHSGLRWVGMCITGN